MGLSEKRNRRIPMYKRHRDAACTVFRNRFLLPVPLGCTSHQDNVSIVRLN